MLNCTSRPPNYARIVDAFPSIAGKAVIFAFGNRIYNPCGIKLSPWLRAHEQVHSDRQGAQVERWWEKYLVDPAFRLDEEIPAHIAEYLSFCAEFTDCPGRNSRRVMLHAIASRLASDIYGRLIKYDDARRLLKQASKCA